ncbi:MAG: serpin family protein [Mucilaginibacter sp.]
MKTKHITPLLLFSFLVIALASCKKGGLDPVNGKDLVLTAQEQQKVTSDNVFSLKLYQNLSANSSGTDNLFVSPLSVSFALAMTSNGAGGETLTAMRNTLDFNGYTADFINSYYNKLITELPKLDSKTTINIANSIWYKQDFSVLPLFLQINNTFYQAKVQGLDFTNPGSANQINNWVSDQTKGKITSIINSIPAGVVMYLVNTIYFKSSWNEKFNAAKTAKQTFYLPGSNTVQADFMSNTTHLNEYKTNDITVVELPYSGSKYSMVIAMPAASSVNQMVAGLDSAKWQSWMDNLHGGEAQIKLPKFKFSSTFTLNNALAALGMGNAFTKEADFSRINATAPLHITEVMHKAFIDVNEDGTTAAAATSVAIGITAIAPVPDATIDHPFLFVIREMKSGLILFAGTVNNPTL